MMETYITQPTDNEWLQGLQKIAYKQVQEREASRFKRDDSEKVLQGAWPQMVLQGWKLLFTPSPLRPKETRTESRETLSEETSAQAPETQEMPDISCETSQDGPDNHHLSQVLRCGTKINPEGRLRELKQPDNTEECQLVHRLKAEL